MPDSNFRDTRQRVTIASLVPNGEDSQATELLIDQLASLGLVTKDDRSVELTHESLITYGPVASTLRDPENRESLLLRQRIADEARQWKSDRKRWDLPRLSRTEVWKATRLFARGTAFPLNPEEWNDLQACRIRDYIIAGLVIVAVSIVVLLGWKIRESDRKTASRLASSRFQLSYIESDERKDPMKALLLASEAYNASPMGDPLLDAYAFRTQHLATQAPFRVIDTRESVRGAAFAPNLSWVALADNNWRVRVFDLEKEADLPTSANLLQASRNGSG